MKALAVALTVLVVKAPVLAQLGEAQALQVPESQIMLPNGEEMGDNELLQIEGEAVPAWAVPVIVGFVVGAMTTIKEAFFDEDLGVIDRDDIAEIVVNTVAATLATFIPLRLSGRCAFFGVGRAPRYQAPCGGGGWADEIFMM